MPQKHYGGSKCRQLRAAVNDAVNKCPKTLQWQYASLGLLCDE